MSQETVFVGIGGWTNYSFDKDLRQVVVTNGKETQYDENKRKLVIAYGIPNLTVEQAIALEMGMKIAEFMRTGEYSSDTGRIEKQPNAVYNLKKDPSNVVKTRRCAGRNCFSTDGTNHSRECIEDYEKAAGITSEPAQQDTKLIASLRHLYQNMIDGAVRDTASAKRIATGLLGPVIEQLERAAPHPVQPEEAVARQAIDALEAAKNGLEWYRDRCKDCVDGSDDEMDDQIDAAIAALSRQQDAGGAKGDSWKPGDPEFTA